MTVAGKLRSSSNAHRHGLAALELEQPRHAEEIEEIAKRICGEDGNTELHEAALMIAESDFLLRSVRAERVAVIERVRNVRSTALTRGDKRLALGKARARDAELAYEELVEKYPDLPDKGLIWFGLEMIGESKHPETENLPSLRPVSELFPEERSEVEALLEALPDLSRLDRYVRRAWSRRKRAIQTFIDVKSQRGMR
jgi:hypothetical protein